MNQSEAEKQAELSRKASEEEKKNQGTGEDSNWSAEDIANLTKAIVKFPPGTGNRWKVITEDIGWKNQKMVIKKAQELA